MTARVFRSGEVFVKLDADVVERLQRHAQLERRASEAGGVLIGRRVEGCDDVVVDQITTPLPRDVRARMRFARQDPGHQERITRVWEASGGTLGYLGEWHTHPEPLPAPSRVDWQDWKRRLREDTTDGPDVFFMIVGTHQLALWRADRASRQFERMQPSGGRLPSELKQEVQVMSSQNAKQSKTTRAKKKKKKKSKKKSKTKAETETEDGREFETVTRHIPAKVRYVLVAAAGGRCEFPDCPHYLFEHHLTKDPLNFSQAAHIIAFREGGPRGRDEKRPPGIHGFENLMLLCHPCHKLIDDRPQEYPATQLRTWKREHEERVRLLLDLPRENECAVLEIWTNVDKPPVVRSPAKIFAALRPLYPSKAFAYRINLAGNTMGDDVLVPAAVQSIDSEVDRLFADTGERPEHVAVFGITNIPLLIHLGSRLGDRVDVHLFQHHRDTNNWRWKEDEPAASYTWREVQGGDGGGVALVLSLSGAIIPETGLAGARLPIGEGDAVYELRLASATPNPLFLRTRGDLIGFQEAYRLFQAELSERHGRLERLPPFPAVPVPVAISLGMDRLPKISPTLAVHDNTREGWKHVLDVT